MSNAYYHVTPYANVPSILRQGLLKEKHTGKLPVVWMVKHDRVAWAIDHVCSRHGVEFEEVAVLHLDMAGMAVNPFSYQTYISWLDVPAECIGKVWSAIEYVEGFA